VTAPSYTEDLTDVATGDEGSGWAEFTGNSYNAQGVPVYTDADYPYIQGSYSVSQTCTKTGMGSLGYNYGAGTGGHGTDGAYFVWQNFSSPPACDVYASGGLRIVVGNDLANFKAWYVGGRDKGRYPYGGWQCNVVNTTVSADDTAGTPTSTEQYIGSAVKVTTGISKGDPHQVDVMRFGRGSAIFEYGEVGNYCTIAGFAAQNDNTSYRWGLIQVVPGGYLWKGRMALGTASNAVSFVDSNKIIFIDWTPKVTANFNTIDVVNASSSISMTGFQFVCLDTTTASKGRWITTNNATVTLTSCTFTDMSTFAFDTNTTTSQCTWTRCGQITPAGADLSYALIDSSTAAADTGAVYWNVATDPNTKLDNSIFIKGTNAHHAIEFGTSAPTTINFTNMTFTGFNVSDGQNDSVLLFPDKGTDTTWTVAHTGTSGTLSYKKARSGDTVNISSSVTITITVKDQGGNLLDSVQTAIYKTSDRTQIMNEDTSSGIATENYTGSTPVEVEVRCRKASSGATKYKNYSSIQTVGTTGLTMTVTLAEDPNNNATS
jgi:hypothetical protein